MLKKMKIRARLFLSYIVLILLTVVAGVVAITMLRSVGANLTGFYETQFQTVDQAWTARRGVYAVQSNLFQAVIEQSVSETQKLLDEANKESAAIAATVKVLRTTFQGDQSLLDTVEEEMSQAATVRESLTTAIKANQTEVAYRVMTNEYIPIMDSIRANMTEIGKQADTNALNRVNEGETSTVTAIILVACLVAASAVISVLFALIISNSIIKPVKEIESTARDMAKGMLNANINYTGHDELGQLAENMRVTLRGISTVIDDLSYLMGEIAKGNFNCRSGNADSYLGDFAPCLASIQAMVVRLSDTMNQIDETAEQVSSGSDQVSGGAQALSQGATEQASSVEELAATVNEISMQIKNSAEMAQRVSENVTNVGGEINMSNQKMMEMTTAMNDISRSSSEIGKIIKTIEDIAFQTNILALNAAVEAARAGAAGKGFAVVADEVRNLASKSAEASKNTAALIESSIQSVENGKHIAEDTANALQSVVDGTQEIIVAVNQISSDSINQANAVIQISQGIDQISSVVQTNSATAEESAAASEELSAQATNLKSLVGQFVLRED